DLNVIEPVFARQGHHDAQKCRTEYDVRSMQTGHDEEVCEVVVRRRPVALGDQRSPFDPFVDQEHPCTTKGPPKTAARRCLHRALDGPDSQDDQKRTRKQHNCVDAAKCSMEHQLRPIEHVGRATAYVHERDEQDTEDDQIAKDQDPNPWLAGNLPPLGSRLDARGALSHRHWTGVSIADKSSAILAAVTTSSE